MIFTDTSLKAAEEDYILRWNANAKQHFDDGDYEWICDLINKDLTLHSYHRILEIGCGAGYSTLAFALRDFSIIAIDVNEAAINCTKDGIKLSVLKSASDEQFWGAGLYYPE